MKGGRKAFWDFLILYHDGLGGWDDLLADDVDFESRPCDLSCFNLVCGSDGMCQKGGVSSLSRPDIHVAFGHV